MTALADLAHLARPASGRGGNPALLWTEMRHVIEDAIANDPRTLQVEIGPSSLGTDCLRCLGMMLAGIPEERDSAWLPTVGRAVHAWLEETFAAANAGLPAARWLIETRVQVGVIDGRPIRGNVDIYDRVTATVTDWKVQGITQQRKLKASGPSTTYRVQLHLYAKGLRDRGLPVDTVQLISLPRNEPTLSGAVEWHEPYRPEIAEQALARADALAKAIRLAGAETVIPGLQATPDCFSCPRFRNLDGTTPFAKEGADDRAAKQLDGLIPQTPAATAAGSTAA